MMSINNYEPIMKNRIEKVRKHGENMQHSVLSELTVDLHFIVLYHLPGLIRGHTGVSPSIVLLCVQDLQSPASWKIVEHQRISEVTVAPEYAQTTRALVLTISLFPLWHASSVTDIWHRTNYSYSWVLHSGQGQSQVLSSPLWEWLSPDWPPWVSVYPAALSSLFS